MVTIFSYCGTSAGTSGVRHGERNDVANENDTQAATTSQWYYTTIQIGYLGPPLSTCDLVTSVSEATLKR